RELLLALLLGLAHRRLETLGALALESFPFLSQRGALGDRLVDEAPRLVQRRGGPPFALGHQLEDRAVQEDAQQQQQQREVDELRGEREPVERHDARRTLVASRISS